MDASGPGGTRRRSSRTLKKALGQEPARQAARQALQTAIDGFDAAA